MHFYLINLFDSPFATLYHFNFFLFFCFALISIFFSISFFQIYSFGFYSVPTTFENSVNIYLEKPGSIIIQFQTQTSPFLEVTIKSLDDDTYSRIIIDSSQSAIIYGQKVQIFMKENLSPFLNVWVVPREICPEIVFELSNSSGYSYHLHSNMLSDSICIFMPKYTQNISQVVLFGLEPNQHDQLVLYSNEKNNFLNPLKICRNIFELNIF